MQQRHSNNYSASPSLVTNVIVAALTQTSKDRHIDLNEIARLSRTRPEQVKMVLSEVIGHRNLAESSLEISGRFGIALEAVRLGASERALKALSWQEFEQFTAECLGLAGFKVQHGVVFRSSNRRWQVDLFAVRSQTLLAIDCKHWMSPNYPSKFIRAIDHHKQSITPLVHHLRERGILMDQRLWVLPLIITLFQPREPIANAVVFMSVQQLSDFLEHLTPYNQELPFIEYPAVAESSIS